LVKATFEHIKFQCQRCGSCCHHRRPLEFGDLIPVDRLKEFWEKSNLIYLTDEDIHSISRRSHKEPEDFVDTLYRYDGNSVRVEDRGRKVILDLPVMKSKEDTTCVFYEDGCSVYSSRPKACRLFPFRVEEENTKEGDILLNISYNPTCPGIGRGGIIDKGLVEKIVVEQFLQRTEGIFPQIQRLALEGKIEPSAQIFRTLPGRNIRAKSATNKNLADTGYNQ
jgi:Fe-S-cluster containining protein